MTTPPALPKAPDARILPLLQRARLMYEHAVGHTQGTSSIDRMIAIHGFDNTVEYLLRIIVIHLDIEAETNENFDSCELTEIAGRVNKYLGTNHNIKLPYFTEIKKLRQVRNLVQHGNVDPGTESAQFLKIVERLFDSVMVKIFGITRDQIQVSTLVQDATVRNFLASAEEAIKNKKWLAAILASRNAFENAYFMRIRDSEPRIGAASLLGDSEAQSFGVQYFAEIVRNELECVLLGINPAKYTKYKNYLLRIPLEHKSTGSLVPLGREWAKEDAEFCYNFVSDTILRWQSNEQTPVPPPPPPPPGPLTWEEKLDTVDLFKRLTEGGMKFVTGPEQRSHLLYADQAIFDMYSKLEQGKVYQYSIIERKSGRLIREIKSLVRLDRLHKRLITHEPPRWEILVAHSLIPLTYVDTSFDETTGAQVHQTPDINLATTAELRRAVPSLTVEITEKIVSKRQRIRIKAVEDLKTIEGMTDKLISEIGTSVKCEAVINPLPLLPLE